MNTENFEYLIKIVMVGDSGVGKTNLLSRYVRNEFNLDTKGTIGVDFSTKYIKINETDLKIQLWDTAGQEKYRSIIKSYYSNSNGFVLVFDVTRRSTFENLEKWISILREYANKDVVLIIVGNKIDLEENREVSSTEAHLIAETNKCFYIETSAKLNTNNFVQEAFDLLINECYRITNQNRETLINDEISNLQKNKTDLSEKKQSMFKKCC